jgi:hypothetical protein
MRLGPLVLVAVAALGLAGCAGDDEEAAAPLSLDQRVLGEEEAPGSKPDPAETRRTASDLGEVATYIENELIQATPEEATEEFRKAGFVSAIIDTRFFGETHTPDAKHVFVSVAQFEDEQAARDVGEWLHDDSRRPCPERCATQVSDFDVGDVPDATGVRRVATAERIEATGEDAEPYDSYEIRFVDGPFTYSLVLVGPPGDVSEGEAEDLAQALYDRVEGAPPAGSS